jgi:N-acetylneuraminic acid mutarotase
MLYYIGGEPPSGYDTNVVETYDPALNQWTNCGGTCAVLPTSSFTNDGAATVLGLVYVVGGLDEGAPSGQLDRVEEFDPTQNAWTNCGTPAPGNACAPAPTKRSSHAAVAADGKVYVLGGTSPPGATYITTVEAFAPPP